MLFLAQEVAHNVPNRVGGKHRRNSKPSAQQRCECALTCARSPSKQHNHVDFLLHQERRNKEVFHTVGFLELILVEAILQNLLESLNRRCHTFEIFDLADLCDSVTHDLCDHFEDGLGNLLSLGLLAPFHHLTRGPKQLSAELSDDFSKPYLCIRLASNEVFWTEPSSRGCLDFVNRVA